MQSFVSSVVLVLWIPENLYYGLSTSESELYIIDLGLRALESDIQTSTLGCGLLVLALGSVLLRL